MIRGRHSSGQSQGTITLLQLTLSIVMEESCSLFMSPVNAMDSFKIILCDKSFYKLLRFTRYLEICIRVIFIRSAGADYDLVLDLIEIQAVKTNRFESHSFLLAECKV